MTDATLDDQLASLFQEQDTKQDQNARIKELERQLREASKEADKLRNARDKAKKEVEDLRARNERLSEKAAASDKHRKQVEHEFNQKLVQYKARLAREQAIAQSRMMPMAAAEEQAESEDTADAATLEDLGLNAAAIRALTEAGYDDVAKVRKAHADGVIAEVKGIGPKAQSQIAEALDA
ncbi:hypothetical protein Q4589_02845 [Cobetia marina]|jgi:chromosome segregation ATPase|uniref:hypothetical protein n=1 Tax=Cobetia TaxID=204286 RepID=UPI001596EAFB|nr:MULTISPECIES: hypothetical protein [Cobetia]MDH2289780.1 hypothetical protein [Cobetia sp. 10Alg 146]MDN2656046.1 hypothetical protein [Cobetia sp. 14N.309.X.WAT.E.A4]MDO6786523.1 hypothetical protein [Cobetia marina]